METMIDTYGSDLNLVTVVAQSTNYGEDYVAELLKEAKGKHAVLMDEVQEPLEDEEEPKSVMQRYRAMSGNWYFVDASGSISARGETLFGAEPLLTKLTGRKMPKAAKAKPGKLGGPGKAFGYSKGGAPGGMPGGAMPGGAVPPEEGSSDKGAAEPEPGGDEGKANKPDKAGSPEPE